MSCFTLAVCYCILRSHHFSPIALIWSKILSGEKSRRIGSVVLRRTSARPHMLMQDLLSEEGSVIEITCTGIATLTWEKDVTETNLGHNYNFFPGSCWAPGIDWVLGNGSCYTILIWLTKWQCKIMSDLNILMYTVILTNSYKTNKSDKQ